MGGIVARRAGLDTGYPFSTHGQSGLVLTVLPQLPLATLLACPSTPPTRADSTQSPTPPLGRNRLRQDQGLRLHQRRQGRQGVQELIS